ncbi:hypothetical protein LUZ60_000430 [Juncus effusus]|nr:hypothetical protein LUZ60_000430 [Juncus effusus]
MYNLDAAPRFVIAFRGTMLDKRHLIRDVYLDYRVTVGGLNKLSRAKNAIAMVEKFADNAGASNVWLTGHSLGAPPLQQLLVYKYVHFVLKDPFYHLSSQKQHLGLRKMIPLVFSISKFDPFEVSGPKHLTTVNWSNPHHQRSIMACMVQGAYVVERDRIKQRKQRLAPDWWENFHYELVDKVIDVHDHSIYGIVLRFKQHQVSPATTVYNRDAAPRFVIAFRGTMVEKGQAIRDVFLDLRLCMGSLNKTSRIQNAILMVEKFVKDFGASNVWLTGHSLGASTATIIGKYMAKEKDIHLKTFLFNPPFAEIPCELIPDGIHMAKTFFKGALTYILEDQRKKSQKNFAKLTLWTPYLFVHHADLISMGYIKYFKQRKDLEGTEASGVAQLATRSSVREMISNLFRKGSEMSHLLPSASLNVSRKRMDNFIMTHMIFPWWEPDLELETSEHRYDVNSNDHDQTRIEEKGNENCKESLCHEDNNVKLYMQGALQQSTK